MSFGVAFRWSNCGQKNAKHLSINCSSLYINIPYDNFPDSSRDAFSFLYIALHLSCELGFKCQISSVDIRGI